MLNTYLNQWSKASLICGQSNDENYFEYKVADAIINFVKSKLGINKKTA